MKFIYRTTYTNDLRLTLHHEFGVTEKVIISIIQQEILRGPLDIKRYEYIIVYKEQVDEVPLISDGPKCCCGKSAIVKTTHKSGVVNYQCIEHDVYNQAEREYLK